MKKKILYKLSEIKKISKHILDLLGDNKIILFRGEIGAGKTTLIKNIFKQMGIKDNVTSPTFSIVNEYHINQEIICHFDLYRIKSVEELNVIGFESYLDDQKICFIEWPEIILKYLPKDYLDVYICEYKDIRKVEITNYK
tara:strand:+ start:1029 stop:1448 length:420 start_codon:yes stop_codon:yes gene_type:complete